MKGRKCDVIIDNDYYTDPRTGVQQRFNYFNVWADSNLSKLIESIEGVTNVFMIHNENNYHVYIDPRYDREYLRKEIEAHIKIGE